MRRYARGRGGAGSPQRGEGDAGAEFFRSGSWRARPTPHVYEPAFAYAPDAQAAAGAIARMYRGRLQVRMPVRLPECASHWTCAYPNATARMAICITVCMRAPLD